MLSDGGRRTLPTLDVLLACALRGDSEANPSTPRSDAARLAAARASHAAASERAASELVRVRVRVRVNANADANPKP